MPRIRYSQETKQQAVKLVLNDHLTVTDAAKQIGCNLNTVHKWIKKSKKITEPKKNGFIPLQIVENSSVDLVLPNGFMLKINNASPEFIAVVFKSLATC